MMTFTPRFDLVVEVCKGLDRRQAASILREDLNNGPEAGLFWYDFAQLAMQLGEQKLCMESARRYAATVPNDVNRALYYARILSKFGRLKEALSNIMDLDKKLINHPGILHFMGVTATSLGDFRAAETYLRKAISISPAPIQWLALSVLKKFEKGDPDIAAMENILPRIGKAPPEIKAQLLYALAKAYDDAGQYENAEQAYISGANQMRIVNGGGERFQWKEFAKQITAGYSPENLKKLMPSSENSDKVIFVTGYPRSGTTLVEQILTSHSDISDGAELNLLSVALMPAGNLRFGQSDQMDENLEISTTYPFYGDFTFENAFDYQSRINTPDPWGEIGADYLKMIDERFETGNRVVDKTVIIGQFVGPILHSLPKSKMIWMRRNPEDCALSIFKLYSQPGTIPWSYSPEDIANFFKSEDILFEHWINLFPDRILIVHYESLVSEPDVWIRKILDHVNLVEQPQVFEPHNTHRAVTTASVAQVRAPISQNRIGASKNYMTFTDRFRKAYYSE